MAAAEISLDIHLPQGKFFIHFVLEFFLLPLYLQMSQAGGFPFMFFQIFFQRGGVLFKKMVTFSLCIFHTDR